MAYSFAAASTQYFSVGSSPVSGFPLTLSAWFYANSSVGTVFPFVLLHSSVDVSRINLARSGSDIVTSAISPTLFGTSVSAGAFATGQWKHAVGVHSSASSRTVYSDGIAASPETTSIGSFSAFDRVKIGTNHNLSSFHDGRIAEVGIWNVALSAAEVASLAKGVACRLIRPQSLVFYAPLIRDAIDTARGLVLTNNNAATVSDHPRIYA